LSGTTQAGQYQKGKPIWILLKQETVTGSGITWPYASLAHRSRQKTMPAPHHSVFYGAGCPSCRPTNSVKALKANAFTFHSTQKVNSETFPKPISWLDMDKTKPNKTKACIHQSKEMHYNKK